MSTRSASGIKEELRGIAGFIGVMWAAWVISWLINLNQFGLTPRDFWPGMLGIVTMPFLHGDLWHLIGNTVPLCILLMLLAGSKAKSWGITTSIILLGGGLLWVFGRSATHVGASALVFGLISFLIFSGFLEKRVVSIVVAVVTAFLYGGTLVFGVLPTGGEHVSWDGHLCGAVAGAIVAWGVKGPLCSTP